MACNDQFQEDNKRKIHEFNETLRKILYDKIFVIDGDDDFYSMYQKDVDDD